ncbi:MAG: hypothetical protein KI792_09350 [Alphaproteobacteria bacterium]|nr:hypothetical protein [Alphaproteobacteria bacterium SS10]
MTHFGRSGSTVLAIMLSQHPGIDWRQEIFTAALQDKKNLTPPDYHKLVASQTSKKTDITGLEVKPINFFKRSNTTIRPFLSGYFRDDCQHIFLERKNVLKRMISAHRASKNQVYHVLKGQQPPDDKVLIDLDNFTDFDTMSSGTLKHTVTGAVEYNRGLIEFLEEKQPGFLHLTYEDDVEQDPNIAYEKILNFLGLEQVPAKIQLQKTGKSLAEDIGNYDEVRAHLETTEHAWMLD